MTDTLGYLVSYTGHLGSFASRIKKSLASTVFISKRYLLTIQEYCLGPLSASCLLSRGQADPFSRTALRNLSNADPGKTVVNRSIFFLARARGANIGYQA